MKRSPLQSPYLFPLLIAVGCGETMMEPPPEDLEDLSIVLLDAGPSPDGGGTDGGAQSSLPGSGADLRIARDERGVPHITAATLEDAMYGLGFVQAEDRLFQLQVRRLRMQGRLAEFFALAPREANAEAVNARLINDDLRMRALDSDATAARIFEGMDDSYQRLLTAFAEGINDQMAERSALGTAFERAGIDSVERFEPHHAILAWEGMGEIFGSTWGQIRDELSQYDDCRDGTCSPISCVLTTVDEEAAIVPEPEDGVWPPSGGLMARSAPLPQLGQIRAPVAVKASQGFVVAGDLVEGGRPVMFGEPQLILEAPSVWYEAAISVASEGIAARGIGFAGSPGMVIFYNEHVSQTVTAGGGDLADLVALRVNDAGDSYIVDGAAVAFTTRMERFAIRHHAERTLPIRDTRYGPVVSDVFDDEQRGKAGGTTFAVRRVSASRPGEHSIMAGIELMRARSLRDYRDALTHWVSPTVNALYAGVDEDGESHIAFHSLLMIPERVRTTVDGRDSTGRYPIDGSRSANDWQGFLPLDWNPHAIDPEDGYLFSGNHMPVGTWYDDVVYSGLRGGGDTLRSFELRMRLQELAATGPHAAEAYHALHVDSESEGLRTLIDALEVMEGRGVIPADSGQNLNPEGTPERAARLLTWLRAWRDATGGVLDAAHPYSHIADLFLGQSGTAARTVDFGCTWAASEAGAAHFMRRFREDPSVLGAAERTWLMQAVSLTWQRAFPTARLNAGASLRDLFNELATIDPNQGEVPVRDGVRAHVLPYQQDFRCLGAEDSDSCSLVNDVRPVAFLRHRFINTISSARASSWPVTVDFAEDGIRAWALLAPGVSEEPDSVHFSDQIAAMEQKGAGEIGAIPAAPLRLSAPGRVREFARR
ncbi:MAG: penicillin acylase family protein [Myxococcota bacterium]